MLWLLRLAEDWEGFKNISDLRSWRDLADNICMERRTIATEQASRKSHRDDRRPAAIVLLVLIVIAVLGGFYRLLIEPMISMDVPEHHPVAIDTPLSELTSFTVRDGETTLQPQLITVDKDTVFVSFKDSSLLHIYSGDLKLLKRIELTRPHTARPVALCVKDSFLIVGDREGGIGIYDRSGYFLSSFHKYPDSARLVSPAHLFSNGRLLAVTDQNEGKVALISLVEHQPFYTFMELLQQVPGSRIKGFERPTCAILLPQNRLAVGYRDRAGLFTYGGNFLKKLEQSPRTKIMKPVDFALVNHAVEFDLPEGAPPLTEWRLHLLDREAGKVFVYDLSGRLTLIYPQDRTLHDPTAIADNPAKRHVLVVENGDQRITVFGY